jgi:polyisoprenoid-binding protein YceI
MTINHSTLHRYFPTKEDLIAEVVSYATGQLATTMPPEGTPAEQVMRHLRLMGQAIQDRTELFIVLCELNLRANRDPAIRAIIDRSDQNWQGPIETRAIGMAARFRCRAGHLVDHRRDQGNDLPPDHRARDSRTARAATQPGAGPMTDGDDNVEHAVTQISDYLPGTWTIDPAHSTVSFRVRHLLVHQVRGTFGVFSGRIVTGERPESSSAAATVEMVSMDTGDSRRDRGTFVKDPFDIADHPVMTYRSTAVTSGDEAWRGDGELTVRGVTRAVALQVQPPRFFRDASGQHRACFTATGRINRQAFGVRFPIPLDRFGVLAGNTITIELIIEAALNPDDPS